MTQLISLNSDVICYEVLPYLELEDQAKFMSSCKTLAKMGKTAPQAKEFRLLQNIKLSYPSDMIKLIGIKNIRAASEINPATDFSYYLIKDLPQPCLNVVMSRGKTSSGEVYFMAQVAKNPKAEYVILLADPRGPGASRRIIISTQTSSVSKDLRWDGGVFNNACFKETAMMSNNAMRRCISTRATIQDLLPALSCQHKYSV